MNRNVISAVVLVLFGTFFTGNRVYGDENDFKINQIGYYTSAPKYAIVKNTKATTFEITDNSGAIAYSSNLNTAKVWNGDTVSIADFSAFKQEGEYKIKVSDKGSSYTFKISPTVLKEVSIASLKSFYYQRCSMELTEEFAGKFARAAGHPDTACIYHASSGITSTETISSSKGWYDAGDYGKYVVNAGITVGTLLQFQENFPNYFSDKTVNIPESGNGINDLLDEVKYELDWLKTMQYTDGKVFHKMTSLGFCGMVAPVDDLKLRYVIGVSTAATFDFAAVMAMAGRIYKEIDKEYADDCIERAKKAWDWAIANPDVSYWNDTIYKKISGTMGKVETGEYGDINFSDEKKWAAAELYITTKDDVYKKVLDSVIVNYSSVPSWQSLGSLASLSLATISNGLDSTVVAGIRTSIVTKADKFITEIEASGYRVPTLSFYWGSNSNVANIGVMLIYAYQITKDPKYVYAAANLSDYLLGRNGVSYCFMTGFGSLSPQSPHHRPSAGDTIKAPVPGLLVGGPNGGARSYHDEEGDYETNEVAINWNAPSTFLFGALDQIISSNFTSAGIRFRSAGSSAFRGPVPIYSKGQLHFYLNNPQQSWLKIFDLRGKMIKDLSLSVKQMSKGRVVLDLRNSDASGVYIIRYYDGNRHFSLIANKTK